MPIPSGRIALAALVLFVVTASAQRPLHDLFQDPLKTQPSLWANKPDIAAFEQAENNHLAQAQSAIDRLVAVQGLRIIDNTLAPYDEAIRQFNTASDFSGLMQQVHPDSAFRDHATAMTAKVSSAVTALSLNRQAYQALTSLDISKADTATRYYVQRQLLEFRLAGVDKDDATRAKLRKLQDQLTQDQSAFDRNISDDQKTIEIASASELDGMPQDYIDSHKPGPDGKITITTNYPDFFPIITFAKSDNLRRELWAAFNNRAYPKNRDVLKDMMQTRYQIATLLDFASWADYNAADKMIGNGGNIAKFIAELDTALRPVAQREFNLLLAEKRKTEPAATTLESYEWFYLSELVRRSQYNFDSQSVRPYLPYNQVKQGILDTAANLFHVSFRQEMDAPAWAPGVETWEVLENNQPIGRLYLDMHPRPGKYSHAEMAPVLDGIRGKQLPEAALVCNFAEPTATDPGLMDYSDAVTFFHEFGHMMHHILGGRQQWAGIAGISMETDFVEAPSQMLEEWMRSPQVLATFARDYKTGAPIPAELVARLDRADTFGRASNVAFQNAFAALSYDIYKSKPESIDLEATTLHDLQQHTLLGSVPSDAHFYASFNHLAGYSSAYYTYMWDKVIAEDFYQQFDQKNALAGDTPMRYRRQVLEPGGSMSANDLVKNFLGRPQNTAAFQQWMSEEFETTPPTGKPEIK